MRDRRWATSIFYPTDNQPRDACWRDPGLQPLGMTWTWHDDTDVRERLCAALAALA
jgi:hypothetical protein